MRFDIAASAAADWTALVRGLVRDEIPEDRDLDYKRDLNLADASQRKELAADVAAMANTVGGALVFGVAEKEIAGKKTNGPGDVVGVPGLDDKVIQRIEDVLRELVKPRLSMHSLDPIRVTGVADHSLLVIRVRPSVIGPHTVDDRVHARNKSGTYRVGIEELRRMILERHATERELLGWCESRSGGIPRVSAVKRYHQASAVSVRCLPIAHRAFDIGSDPLAKRMRAARVTEAEPHTYDRIHYCEEGVVGVLEGHDDSALATCSIFRERGAELVDSIPGCIRSATTTDREVETRIYLPWLAKHVVWAVQTATTVIGTELDPYPLLVHVALHGVRGARSAPGDWPVPQSVVVRLATDSLAPSPVVLNSPEQSLHATLRPVFDHIWQALGKQRCGLYDAEGKWVPPRPGQIE